MQITLYSHDIAQIDNISYKTNCPEKYHRRLIVVIHKFKKIHLIINFIQ